MEEKITYRKKYSKEQGGWIHVVMYQLNYRTTILDRDIASAHVDNFALEEHTKNMMKYKLILQFERDAIERFSKNPSGTYEGMPIKLSNELPEDSAFIVMHPAMFVRLINKGRIVTPPTTTPILKDEPISTDKEIAE